MNTYTDDDILYVAYSIYTEYGDRVLHCHTLTHLQCVIDNYCSQIQGLRPLCRGPVDDKLIDFQHSIGRSFRYHQVWIDDVS